MWTRLGTLVLALAWDAFLGEPPEPVHPVVGMGRAVDAASRRGMDGTAREQTARGALLAGALPLAAFSAGTVAIKSLRSLGAIPAMIGGAFLLKTTFAVSGMRRAGNRVSESLADGDLPAARSAVGKIVSRDVSDLDESGVASAAVGSIAENVTDSAIGPLLAFALLGVPGALAYRAVSTMDSMIGYRDHRRHFGRAAARLDDIVNWIPARIGGASVVAASAASGMDSRAAWRTMIDEHSRTQSPNGGWPIGAAAGALGVEIEKVGYYRLGPPGERPERSDIDRSLRLFTGAAAVGVLMAVIVVAARHR